MKTSELSGAALDWAVAKCEFGDDIPAGFGSPSTNWAKGGPIIERERIEFKRVINVPPPLYGLYVATLSRSDEPRVYGPTPLIAAMRCYVASKIGDDVEIPEELT